MQIFWHRKKLELKQLAHEHNIDILFVQETHFTKKNQIIQLDTVSQRHDLSTRRHMHLYKKMHLTVSNYAVTNRST